jgi:hypothetical protein
MNVGANFNKYGFKTAIINFVQIFLIGWFVMSLLLFFLSTTSEYGFEITINDMSIDLFLSPIFWMFPLMVAIVLSTLRGIRRDNSSITTPKQLKAHMESQKFSNQPLWFKVLVGFMIVLFVSGFFKPDTEISQKDYAKIDSVLARVNSPILHDFHANISKDGRIMGKELQDFINLSMKVEFGRVTE